MTAPVSPIHGVVQTLLSIRSLQQQDEAQRLSREQFGLSTDVAHEKAVSDLQTILSNSQDPSKFEQYAPKLAQLTGQSEDFIKTLIQGAAPSKSTTEAGVIAAGVKGAAGTIEVPAAFAQLVGQQPGALAGDAFTKDIMEGAQSFYSGLPPEKRTQFNSRVSERIGTGMKPADAMFDEMIQGLDSATKQQILLVGKGIAPSASEDAQIRLGWANYRAHMREIEDTAAYHGIMGRAAMAEVQAKKGSMDGTVYKEINNLLTQKDQLVQKLTTTSATLTPAGRVETSQLINSYNEQLRRLAPDIFGRRVVDPKTGMSAIVGGTVPLPDMETGSTIGATGFAPFMQQWMQGRAGGIQAELDNLQAQNQPQNKTP